MRRDWYQSDEKVILALLSKNTKNVKVDFQETTVTVTGNDKGNISEIYCTISTFAAYFLRVFFINLCSETKKHKLSFLLIFILGILP
jgi:hypothetical protein